MKERGTEYNKEEEKGEEEKRTKIQPKGTNTKGRGKRERREARGKNGKEKEKRICSEQKKTGSGKQRS